MSEADTSVGGDILAIVTSGMYDKPLAVVREYIQNSADAYASVGVADGKVDISIDPANRSLKILDHGPGIAVNEALRSLTPIACSEKTIEHNRGFRGIGRLSGLAFADRVSLSTRSSGDSHALKVVWDGAKLRHGIAQGRSAADAIKESVTWCRTKSDGLPSSFFEVEVSGVARHAAADLLNREKVRRYIAEVCPVPFGKSFGFGNETGAITGSQEPLCELRIRINGDPEPIERKLTDRFKISDSRQDVLGELETMEIVSVDGEMCAAVAWFAHSSYFGAVQKSAGIRGIRARIGNIQIGSETIFEQLFDEERFNRWCVGEVHVLDKRIVPNVRRDYFEPNPHLHNLESKLTVLFKRLSARCRQASRARNRNKQISSELERLNESLELATSGYLDHELATEICTDAARRVGKLKMLVESIGQNTSMDCSSEIEDLKSRFDAIMRQPREHGHTSAVVREFSYLRPIFGTLARKLGSHSEARAMIEHIIESLRRTDT